MSKSVKIAAFSIGAALSIFTTDSPALSGNQYRALPESHRHAWVVGVIDGIGYRTRSGDQ
jgi:hypothetical protein